MKQDLVDELLDALQQLKTEQKTLTLSTPIPPHKVINTIIPVIRKHELTFEDKRTLAANAMALHGLTAEDIRTLNSLTSDDPAENA